MGKTDDELRGWLGQKGVSKGVIDEELPYLRTKYGDGADQAAEGALGSYIQRSRSGNQSEGGYDSRHDDPAVNTEYGDAAARTDSEYDTFPDGSSSRPRPPSGTGPSGTVSQAYQAYVAPAPDPMLAKLVQQMEADRARNEADRVRQEQERQQMRQIVMEQLGQATAPVDANSPGLKPIIDSQKLSLQRGAQRQRSAAVEQAGARGLGDSGAMDTRINQIEQGRGESEAGMIGQILYNENNAKRGHLMQLLDLATRSGDAESARTLQASLATLDQQMTQQRFQADLGLRNRALDVQDQQFGQDLSFRRDSFDRGLGQQRYAYDNDLAFRLAQLQLMGNQSSLGFLGGLL